MALASYTLTNGQWKKISSAGYSGAAWLKSANGFNPSIIISHTEAPQNPADDIDYANAVNLDIDIAYTLPQHGSSEELIPDSASDIFYATILNTNKTCEIIADFTEL